MIYFIPERPAPNTKSTAEKKLFNVFNNLQLDGDVYVLHSVVITEHEKKFFGEADFVIICSLGIACLEVKGGIIEFNNGAWIHKNHLGEIKQTEYEGPFNQVRGNRASLEKMIWDKLAVKSINYAYGVMLPDMVFDSDIMENPQKVVYDIRTTNITQYIKNIFEYSKKQSSRPLSPQNINDIVNYIRGNISCITTLGDSLRNTDRELIHLTEEQFYIIDGLKENKHICVEGTAGTGKTTLATYYAEERSKAGDKVLLLTFNKNLARDIGSKTADNIKVINIHALFGEYVKVDPHEIETNGFEYFWKQLPDEFCQYCESLSETEKENISYDTVVIDEAQDMITVENLFCIEAILKGGLKNGRWAMFYDKKQNIYNKSFDDAFDMLSENGAVFFKLSKNCRNTRKIGNYTYKTSGIAVNDCLNLGGEDIIYRTYKNDEDFGTKLKALIKELTASGIEAGDITVLSPKGITKSRLFGANIKLNSLNDDFKPNKNIPVYSTIQGFKGLDSKVVILVDTKDIKQTELFYIGLSRARALLCVLAHENYVMPTIGKIE